MEERRNNRKVENRLKDALRHDRARIQVGRISHFGLLEMSRQRLRTGVLEGSTTQCPHCQGTGIIRSVESVALAVLRALEDQLLRDARTSLTAVTTADVALYILNNKRAFVTDMERRYGVVIAVQASDRMQGANFAIERSAAQAGAAESRRARGRQHGVGLRAPGGRGGRRRGDRGGAPSAAATAAVRGAGAGAAGATSAAATIGRRIASIAAASGPSSRTTARRTTPVPRSRRTPMSRSPARTLPRRRPTIRPGSASSHPSRTARTAARTGQAAAGGADAGAAGAAATGTTPRASTGTTSTATMSRRSEGDAGNGALEPDAGRVDERRDVPRGEAGSSRRRETAPEPARSERRGAALRAAGAGEGTGAALAGARGPLQRRGRSASPGRARTRGGEPRRPGSRSPSTHSPSPSPRTRTRRGRPARAGGSGSFSGE